MSRAAYHAARRAARDRMESREERGLPAHPANGWIYCPQCEGSGEVNQEWVAEDHEVSDSCPTCLGDGEVLDGHVDVLVQLRKVRARYVRRQPAPYGWMRKRALSGSPLAQLRMIEAAIGCDLECRAAVRAWRAVA